MVAHNTSSVGGDSLELLTPRQSLLHVHMHCVDCHYDVYSETATVSNYAQRATQGQARVWALCNYVCWQVK